MFELDGSGILLKDVPKSPRVAPAQKLRLIPTAPQAIEAVPEVSYPTPVLMVPPVDNSRRLDEFEDRLLHQEKTTQSLIDKAYKIKEDLVDAMGLSQGSWQTEKQARALLSDHIKNITVIVKRLSREIEVVEDQLRARDGVVQGAEGAVKNLELRQITSVADLQSRVGRCDAAIARTSADIRTVFESIRNINGQQQSQNDALNNKLFNLDARINQLTQSFDTKTSDHSSKLKAVEGDSSTAVARLDSKYAGICEDLRSSLLATRNWSETERGKLENQFLAYMETHKQYYENRLVKIERYMEERLLALEKRVESLEAFRENVVHSTEREEDQQKFVSWERAVEKRINELEKKLLSVLAKHRDEVDEGFVSLQSSMETMKAVTEGKRRLTEDVLREAIEDIRKLFVLV